MSTSEGTGPADAAARQPISIRLLVALVAVLPVAAVSAALVALSSDTGRRIAEDMADTLAQSATEQVRSDVATFLGRAIEVSDRYALRVREGRLPVAGADLSQSWRQQMFDDLTTTPAVASICFGNAAGDSTWLLRGQQAPLELGHSDGSRDCAAIEFAVDPNSGGVATTPIREYQYDPRKRPWYATAIRSGVPQWTPIYFWFGESGADRTTGSGYTRVVYDAAGKPLGVLVIDVTLESLSATLRGLPIVERGFAFIVDERGLLVAASRGPVNSRSGNRLRLDESDDAFARGVSRLSYMTQAAADAERMHRFTADGQPARATIRVLSPSPGIDWRVIVGAPESAFLAEAQALQRRQIVLASIVVGASMLLALLLGRAVTRPLLRLTDHVRRVGRGDLNATLDLQATREFRVLSHELNRMSSGLKERIELERAMELAMEVQQGLLPAKVPQVPGLDLAAHCRYCDVTGGDYYDFIEVTELPESRVMIAIGDALGHGIASALLMATARAALRAAAAAPGPLSLGEVMVRVNTVLSHGARQGRFMTMLLLIADPLARTVRWARAGHEPVILYDPSRDAFDNLSEGSIPLGIERVPFDEYRYDGLAPGTILVAGTDGLWEAMNPDGEMFGRDRLREVVRTAARGEPGGPPPGAAEIVGAIDRALTEFVADRKIKDDVTLVVLRVMERNAVDVRPHEASQ